MAEENAGTEEGAEIQPIIPGTSFKTPEEAAKGYSELKQLVDRQGNDLGYARKQLDQTQKMLQESMQKPTEAKAPGPDYDGELAKIDKSIASLDLDDDDYSKSLSKLNREARSLEAKKVETRTAEKMMKQFEKTLTERDSQQSKQQWLDSNPDFNSDEMQSAIQQKMTADRSGMIDPILAYREIQQEQMSGQLKAEQEKSAALEERLKLKEGAQQTGKVITKGQSTQATTNKPKLKGADLDAAMNEAYNNASGM